MTPDRGQLDRIMLRALANGRVVLEIPQHKFTLQFKVQIQGGVA